MRAASQGGGKAEVVSELILHLSGRLRGIDILAGLLVVHEPTLGGMFSTGVKTEQFTLLQDGAWGS